jgi:hypothetical protein
MCDETFRQTYRNWRENTRCVIDPPRIFLLTVKVQIIHSEPERGGVPRCVRERLVHPVGTLQILHQDAHHEGPAAGETHRGQVRDPLSAPLRFGECNTFSLQ